MQPTLTPLVPMRAAIWLGVNYWWVDLCPAEHYNSQETVIADRACSKRAYSCGFTTWREAADFAYDATHPVQHPRLTSSERSLA